MLLVIFTVFVMYTAFGQFCVMAWGNQITTPLITDRLQEGTVTNVIKVLFCLNLLFSYPLVLYPANMIIEGQVFGRWKANEPDSRKLFWATNVLRTLIVIASTLFTLQLGQRVDQFLGLIGALTCAPISFLFPALFHLRIHQMLEDER